MYEITRCNQSGHGTRLLVTINLDHVRDNSLQSVWALYKITRYSQSGPCTRQIVTINLDFVQDYSLQSIWTMYEITRCNQSGHCTRLLVTINLDHGRDNSLQSIQSTRSRRFRMFLLKNTFIVSSLYSASFVPLDIVIVSNAQSACTIISRRYTDIKVDSPCGIKGWS